MIVLEVGLKKFWKWESKKTVNNKIYYAKNLHEKTEHKNASRGRLSK